MSPYSFLSVIRQLIGARVQVISPTTACIEPLWHGTRGPWRRSQDIVRIDNLEPQAGRLRLASIAPCFVPTSSSFAPSLTRAGNSTRVWVSDGESTVDLPSTASGVR